jgi:MFS family permease
MSYQQAKKTLILIICLLGASFYFYETILEIIPSTMINGIMGTYHINGFKAGIFDTCYFVTYAIMQIPGGALLDKYGARKVMPLAALSCFVGLSLFGITDHYYVGLLGRLIAGLGGTFGLMGAMFIVSSWVPSKHLALALGLTITLGLSGGLTEGALTSLVHLEGWRWVTLMLAFIALAIAVLMFLVLRDNTHRTRQRTSLTDILNVIKSKQNRWIGLFGGLLYVPTGTIASLWGVNFFHTYFPTISLSTAANINSMIFLGWIVGSPAAGFISDAIKRRRLLLVLSSACCVLIFLAISYFDHLSITKMFVLFFLIGLFSSFSGLTFVMAIERNPTSSGAVIGFINMLAIIPTIIIAPLFGKILDHFWDGRLFHGARIFSLHAYQQGMKLEALLIGFAVVVAVVFVKEKNAFP